MYCRHLIPFGAWMRRLSLSAAFSYLTLYDVRIVIGNDNFRRLVLEEQHLLGQMVFSVAFCIMERLLQSKAMAVSDYFGLVS